MAHQLCFCVKIAANSNNSYCNNYIDLKLLNWPVSLICLWYTTSFKKKIISFTFKPHLIICKTSSRKVDGIQYQLKEGISLIQRKNPNERSILLKVLVAPWLEHPTSATEVLGSIGIWYFKIFSVHPVQSNHHSHNSFTCLFNAIPTFIYHV